MLTMIGRIYRDAFGAARAVPLLFLLPLAVEFIQHVIEYRAGMFTSFEGMAAAGNDAGRIGFGQVKSLSLILLIYWVSRWLAFGRDPARPIVGDRISARLFAGVAILFILAGLVPQFGGAFLTPLMPNRALFGIGIAVFVATLVLNIYLMVWKVGAALGNPALTIPASFRTMHGNFWLSLAVDVAIFLPPMIAHYALNILAVGKPAGLVWTLLAVDSLVVGLLGLLMATASFRIAERALTRAGISLT